MVFAGVFGAAERTIKRFEFTFIAPLQFAARKRHRLDVFKVADVDQLPVAELALQRTATCGDCEALLRGEQAYLKTYLRDGRGAYPLRPTPCLIDLDPLPDFDAYASAVRRHSKGGVLRQVRRARDDGFYCRPIARELYQLQCFQIETSKRFRSGPVLQAFLRPPPPSDFANGITLADIAAYCGKSESEFAKNITLPDPPPPRCPYHWALDWGVLRAEASPGLNGTVFPERLAGFISLRRTGNIVRTVTAMGHGNYLPRHVMKLLFHDMMRWLLARQDPAVQGIRYVLYGAIEHGNEGLLAWKRSFAFAPYRFGCIA